MLFRGTKRFKNSFELLQAIDNIGGDSDAYTSPEHSAVVIQVHNKHVKKGLEILSDIILGGNFKPDDIEVERRIIQEEMKQFVDVKGDYVGIDDMSFSLMWKDGSTEAPLFGDEKTIAAVTEEDLNTHYKNSLSRRTSSSASVEISRKSRSTRHIKELFGNLQGKFSAQNHC